MTRKKRINRLSRHLRKTYNFEFTESFKIAKYLIKKRFTSCHWHVGFSVEEEWGVFCGRGCCRGATGRALYIGTDKDGKEVVWNSHDILYYENWKG